MITPAWIQDIINTHDGGWFYPFAVSDTHPLVLEGWTCLHCEGAFAGQSVAVVMPHHPAEGPAVWRATHRGCVRSQLGLEGDTPIQKFYRNEGTDGAGRTLSEVLKFDHDTMERVHDYIQWVFPLPEPSRARPNSPILTPEDIAQFREDVILRLNVHAAVVWFRVFLLDSRWVRKRDHNHLRITRVLRFLTLIHMKAEALKIYTFVTQRMGDLLSPDTAKFWADALIDDTEN